MSYVSRPIFYANYHAKVEPVYYVFKHGDEWYAVVGYRGVRLIVIPVEDLY